MLELAPDMRPTAQQQDSLLILVDVVGSVTVALHGAPEILQQLYGHILRPGAFVVMEKQGFQLRRAHHPMIPFTSRSRLILVQHGNRRLVDLYVVAAQHSFLQFPV